MRRPDKPKETEEPLLFDLPLTGPERDAARQRPSRAPRAAAPPAPSETSGTPAARRSGPVSVPTPEPLLKPGPATGYAGRGRRIAAGAADLLVHAATGVLALLGARWMGAWPEISDWPALAAFLLSFSFLYTVLPLAFWGHTLGMAWAGITARNRDGEPLTFDQTARRWLGGLLTLLTAGLALLVSGHRRSLTDLISGSATYLMEGNDGIS